MTDRPEDRSPDHADPRSERALTVDELTEAADDPASNKQKTGEAQAAENEELDPPA